VELVSMWHRHRPASTPVSEFGYAFASKLLKKTGDDVPSPAPVRHGLEPDGAVPTRDAGVPLSTSHLVDKGTKQPA
jgi:hypothetical protein